jgi:Cu/Zn superoxide dismutase
MQRTTLAKGFRTVLAAAVLIVAAAVPAGASDDLRFRGPLTDLQTDSANPTDGAAARARVIETESRSIVRLQLSGLDPAAAGTVFGAHVHIGPCMAGDGAAAGPHYNIGEAPSAHSEVWLDFTARASGRAVSLAIVPFRIPAGAGGSIVIHAMPTADDGSAGARLACLPLTF